MGQQTSSSSTTAASAQEDEKSKKQTTSIPLAYEILSSLNIQKEENISIIESNKKLVDDVVNGNTNGRNVKVIYFIRHGELSIFFSYLYPFLFSFHMIEIK